MKKLTLEVKPRKMFGRKIKRLRQQGMLPANIYGKKITSTAVEVPMDLFLKVYQTAGETNIVELLLEGKTQPALIHNVQIHPVSQVLLHADFHQIDLKEKIKAEVPLEFVGKPTVQALTEGILLQLLDRLEVECLPTQIPPKITVDLSKLAKVNDTIYVKDLIMPEKVVVLTFLKAEVVKIGQPTKEEVAPAKEETAAEVAVPEAPVTESETQAQQNLPKKSEKPKAQKD